ncbi:MAG TPA: ABC transporter permease [Aldersonia sp.]
MTATLPRPAPARGESRDFAGTFGLLRLYARRDRIVLPLWVLVLSLPLGPVYIASIESVFPTVADRVAFAASIAASPAQRAMYGPVFDTSIGAVGIWKAGAFYTLIGIASILTVIRHTRADEETGRTELISATAVGRFANLTAALLLCGGGVVAVGVLGTVSLAGAGVPLSGSLAFGLATMGSGLVFTAVAAVAAQVATSARTARGIAFAVLGAGFALRAVGDASSTLSTLSWLSWLSPQGWSLQVRPYAGDRFWVLLLHALLTVVLVAAAYTLASRRDLGGGLLVGRPGPATAPASLSGSFGLAWRLQRMTLLGWTVGLGLYALLLGSVVHGIADELGNGQTMRDVLERLGGAAVLEDGFVRVGYTMLGVAAAAYAISATLRLHGEEDAQRAEPVLAGAVGRRRWAAGHLGFAVLGPVVLMLVAGIVGGLAYGLSAGSVGGKLTSTLGAALVQLPAIWVLVGVAVALFGVVPRFAPVTWGVLSAVIALYLLGSLSGTPQWLLDLVPFTHTPLLPGAAMSWTPVLAMTALAAALFAAGLSALRHRDIA